MIDLWSLNKEKWKKIIGFFKKVEYPIGGMFVFWEGELFNKAVLVKEGELWMISHWVPVNVSVMMSSDY